MKPINETRSLDVLPMGSDDHGFYTYYRFPKSLSRSAPPVISSGAIEQFLIRHFYKDTTLPRYTPPYWWENDLCRVTKAGIWYEYETKLSRSDFIRERTTKSSKVELLESNPERGPNYYYFVCPKDLIKREEIPPFAGLIEVEKRRAGLTMEIAKKAPKRSKLVRENLEGLMLKAFYHRQNWRINPFQDFEEGSGI